MGFGIKIGGLSLPKAIDVTQAAELAIKTQMPLSHLTVCSKLAESLLFGALRKNSIERSFTETAFKTLNPLDPKNFGGIE